MRLLALLLIVVGPGACAVINGLSGDTSLVCDEASCQCPVPDESEEGAVCIGADCECAEGGFLGCVEQDCQVIYPDSGCATFGCSCNPESQGDCACEFGGTCTGFSETAVVQSDLGAGCIGFCECRDDNLCVCTGPSCTMETDGLFCGEDFVCRAAAGASSSGCSESQDCGSNEVCVLFDRDGVGLVGHCFEVVNPAGACDNGGDPTEGAFVGTTSEQVDICPRPVGQSARCDNNRCVDGG